MAAFEFPDISVMGVNSDFIFESREDEGDIQAIGDLELPKIKIG